MNLRNYGSDLPEEGATGSGRPEANFPLTRQSSIYSLTFDELQSTIGGPGKDFGSMNMDELLKSIWSAEENQAMGATSAAQEGVDGGGGGYLQRQGSLTLPRTLSVKTVDQVWKDISKDEGKDSGGFGGSNLPQRQQTLGEITLEEFLVKAGVALEGSNTKTNNYTSVFGNNSGASAANPVYGTEFQQADRGVGVGLIGNTNQIAFQSGNSQLNVNGIRSSQQQQHQQQQQQQQQLFPKPPGLAYANPMNGQLGNPGIRVGVPRISDQTLNCGLVNNLGIQSGGIGGVTAANGSPAVSSEGFGKSNGDTSSVSPVPYAFNGGLRGRKSNPVEKVIERRQKRMLKNRESAARSRARKQAYTMELEAEVAKLKEENEELRKRQAEAMEMQKNQVMEMMNMQRGAKRQCLRRTQTGPW